MTAPGEPPHNPSTRPWVALLTSSIGAIGFIVAAVISVDAKHDKEALSAAVAAKDLMIAELQRQLEASEAARGRAAPPAPTDGAPDPSRSRPGLEASITDEASHGAGPSATAGASGAPPEGLFSYERPLGQLRVRGYGEDQVELVLEAVDNRAATALTLQFLLHNKYSKPYDISLLDPDNNAYVRDSSGGDHPYRSATEMSEVKPLRLEPLSRRRFSIAFSPLTAPGDSISLAATFRIVAKGSFPSDAVRKIEAADIRLRRPKQ